MIIGDGLISSVFLDDSLDYGNYIIFASGVSNSKETDYEKFEREKKLLFSTIENNYNNFKLIYFSSILSDVCDSPYYNHKFEMENLIKNNSSSYIIYRLPQILGCNGNSNNLVNYIKTNIEKKEEIVVYRNAFRSILDIDDLKKIVDFTIMEASNEIINISSIEKIRVSDLCKKIGLILGIEPNLKIVDETKKINWETKNSNVIDFFINQNNIPKKGYTNKVLKKYIKK